MTNDINSRHSPYKGLAPYDVADKDNFFGRGREKQIVLGKIFANNVTLLFAGTGVGKSSLLRAAVIPLLTEQRALDVVYYADWVSEPLDGLKTAIRAQLIENTKITGRELKMGTDLPAFLATCTAYASEPLVLMLDQFEELFQYHARSGRLLPFVDQLAQVINASDLPVSIVLAMREDFLAELNVFKGRIPGLFDNYYRLEQLRIEQAREAIEKPLANVGFHYEDGLVDQLLRDLAAREQARQPGSSAPGADDQEAARVIEPPYLQIVCNELWWAEQGNPHNTITTARYVALGRTTQIVRKHFEQAMAHFSLREQSLAFEMFRYLVTDRGTKMAYRAEDLADAHMLDAPMGEVQPILAYLASKEVRVLRADQRLDQTWYELYHDVFAQIIRAWTQEFQKDASRYIYTQITTAVRKWKQESEDTFLLLRGDRLFRAEEWIETHPDALSEEEHAFIKTSSEYARSDVHWQITEAAKKWLAEKYDSAFLLPGSKLNEAIAWANSHRETLSSEEQTFLRQSWKKYSRGLWLRRGIMAVIVLFAVIAVIAGVYANLQKAEAVAAQAEAVAMQAKAVAAQAEAVAAQAEAEMIQAEAEHQSRVALIRSLVAYALQDNERERGALLARHAYLLNQRDEGIENDQIDAALSAIFRPEAITQDAENLGDMLLVDQVCQRVKLKIALTAEEWKRFTGDVLPHEPACPELSQTYPLHLRSENMIATDLQALSLTINAVLSPVNDVKNDFKGRKSVILDRATGLMWEKVGSLKELDYAGAENYCARLKLEHDDWRLPTVEELLSLMEPKMQENDLYLNPMFDTQGANEENFWYWSSDKKPSAGPAWVVNFSSSKVEAYNVRPPHYVRCVRSLTP